jgi:uncharacterized membrane protein YfcA
MLYVILVIVGTVAGFASGMFGIGGGVIIVPALTVLVGFPLLEATGTSLTAQLLPVGIFAVLAYYRAGHLRWRVVAPVALGLLIGAIGGANLALNLPTATLKGLYGIFLIYMAWRFIEPRKLIRAYQNRGIPAPKAEPQAELHASPYILLGVGLLAGICSGMFGIGGGVVIVPILIALLHFDQKVAVGTSLGALMLPVSIGAVVRYYQAGQLDIIVAVAVAAGLVLGAFLGAKTALSLPTATVKRIYGVFLFFIGLSFIAPLLQTAGH